MLLAILLVGLNPKDFRLRNNVAWIENHGGVHFGKYGIAFSRPAFGNSSSKSLSIHVAFRAGDESHEGVKFMLLFHNGDEAQQLLAGQWRSSMILMNGNDYDNSRRTPRISVSDVFLPHQVRFLSIISGEGEGTQIYLDGRPAGKKKNLLLQIPDVHTLSRLVLGTSANGRHSWTGDIYGLAIFSYALSPADVQSHHEEWARLHNFSFLIKDSVQALYQFDEKSGDRVFDRAAGKCHLEIPANMRILQKEFLIAPWHGVRLNQSLAQDIFMNIIGFLFFGCLLYALLVYKEGKYRDNALLLTVGFCIILSFCIETFQVWLPSRSSQLLDLMLNTLGAVLGVCLIRNLKFGILDSKPP